MSISLRLQIFIWYSLVIIIIILGLVFVAQRVMVEGLRDNIDQRLEERTDTVAAAIMSSPQLSEEAYDLLIEWLTEQELPYVPAVLRVADPQGNVLASFGDIPDPIVPLLDSQLLVPQESEGRFKTIEIRGRESLRIYTIPLFEPNTQKVILLIQTGDSLAQLTTTQNQLWKYTMAVGISGSVVAIVVGFFLLRRGFRPLDRILGRVQEIGSKNLAIKIPEESGPPELRKLTNTLNSMLERLNTSFKDREMFLAGVSHDLRTPLTVLQGQIDVMLMQPSLEEENRQSLQKMSTELRRLTRMTNNLLLSVQLESNPTFSPEEIDLQELLNEVVREVKVLARNLDFKVSMPDIIIIPGDRDLLKQMVLNIIENAIKFTPKSGGIELSLSEETDWAIIKISDTGIGIPPDHLTRITEPFYKVDTPRRHGSGGAGLGLAIVKQVADLHYGQLDIQSQVGVGTTVMIKLPLGYT